MNQESIRPARHGAADRSDGPPVLEASPGAALAGRRVVRLPDLSQPKAAAPQSPVAAAAATVAGVPHDVRSHAAHAPAPRPAEPTVIDIRPKSARLQPIVLLGLIGITFAILVAAIVRQSGKTEAPALPEVTAPPVWQAPKTPSAVAAGEQADDGTDAHAAHDHADEHHAVPKQTGEELPPPTESSQADPSTAPADEGPSLEGPPAEEAAVPAPRNDWPPFPPDGDRATETGPRRSTTGGAESARSTPPADDAQPGMARLEGTIIE
jgi:hypothetical protein